MHRYASAVVAIGLFALPAVEGANIAVIVGDAEAPTVSEQQMVAYLQSPEGGGHAVSLFDDDADDPELICGSDGADPPVYNFDLLIISSTIEPEKVDGDYRTRNIPRIYWASGLFQPCWESMASSATTLPDRTQIWVWSLGHYITQNLLFGYNAVLTTPQPMNVAAVGEFPTYPQAGPGVMVLAEDEIDPSKATILAAEAGYENLRYDGTPFLARQVFLFLSADSFPIDDSSCFTA